MPAVLIYRQRLLPVSEAFIPGQAASVPGWDPTYLGFQDHPGIELDRRSLLIRPARGQYLAYPRLIMYVRHGRVLGAEARLRRLGPRLVHAHFGIDGTQCLSFARTHNLPLLVTFHGYDITVSDAYHCRTRAGRYYVQRREDLFTGAHLLIAVSDFIRNRLLAAGSPPGRTIRHYIGVDIPEKTYDFHPHRDGLLFVGRLVAKKGLATLLNALADWPSPPPKLTVVGDGPERQALESVARRLRVNAIFTGNRPHEAVFREMIDARMLCMPSEPAQNGDDEALGLVALEAQARGLPVLATSTGGIPEAIRSEETGFLVSPGDITSLRRTLMTVYDDEASLRRIATNAAQRVRRDFNRITQGNLLASIYARAAGLAT